MNCIKLQPKLFFYGVGITFLALILFTSAALAATKEDEEPTWTATLAPGVTYAPEFEGSDKHNASFLPLVEIEVMNLVFLSTTKGLGVHAINYEEWKLDVSASYDFGRKEKDSDLLKGMDDIDGGVVFNVYGAWTPGPFTVSLTTSYGTGDVQGLNVTGGVGYTMELLEGMQWENTLSATFADAKYNNTFFGITRKQSRESKHGYDYYDADSGIKDVAFSSTLTYAVTDEIVLMLGGEYKRLVGPAADSPLVKAGSKNQFSSMFAAGYSF